MTLMWLSHWIAFVPYSKIKELKSKEASTGGLEEDGRDVIGELSHIEKILTEKGLVIHEPSTYWDIKRVFS